MKKLFTLIALMAMCLGVKAETVQDYSIDYTTTTSFPFYKMSDEDTFLSFSEAGMKSVNPMGGDPDEAGNPTPSWYQYFVADGIPTQVGGSYTVIFKVKASEECDVKVNMGWGWGEGEQVAQTVHFTTEWSEVEVLYTEIGGSNCNLVAQPGTVTADLEWAAIKVSHEEKASTHETEWTDLLENGNAAVDFDQTIAFDDQTKNYTVCVWTKENAGDPHPALIEEVDGSRVFVCHATDCVTEGDASAWDNQIWIESPKSWAKGDQFRLSFRYKASQTAKTNTQGHKQNPSDYLIWHLIGDVTFTTDWQTFSKIVTVESDQDGMWSCAFNLNPEVKTATDFYLADVKWEVMKLDEGWFVAGDFNDWNYDEAVAFVEKEGNFVATVGTEAKPASSIMISTKRGNDTAFQSNAIKVANMEGAGDPDEWLDYTVAYQKIALPEAGVWTITIDPELQQINFTCPTYDGVVSVSLDEVAPVYYTISGVRVNKPQHGVFIQKQGKVAKKVLF